MTFKTAVKSADPPLNQAYQSGLQALKTAHSGKIICTRPPSKTITGSVDIDSSLARIPQHASENRWDYGVGYKPANGNECSVWIEVHGADIDEVGTLARKAKWLKDYLSQHAPALWQMTLKSPPNLRYVWLGTKDVHLNMNTLAYRRAAQEGITLHGKVLTLP